MLKYMAIRSEVSPGEICSTTTKEVGASRPMVGAEHTFGALKI